MFGLDLTHLSSGLTILFVISILVVFAFEFVNGFHDTANAVATVIYTKTLKPTTAVVWSGFMNLCGVLVSSIYGYDVAMKIAALVPVEALMGQTVAQAACMMLAILLSAVIWNLATWYFGIPCSSSHTLIGALLGAGMVFSMLPENTQHVGINWAEAGKIGTALLFSPAFGFTMAISLMFILRMAVTNKEKRQQLFKEPDVDAEPPMWIRAILITTCTLVSFFHGQNDGQKGLGLLLVTLMTFAPLQFALSPDFSADKINKSLTEIQAQLQSKEVAEGLAPKELTKSVETIELLKQDIAVMQPTDVKSKLNVRKRIGILTKHLKTLLEEPNVITDKKAREVIKHESKTLSKTTQHVPFWGLLCISLALGFGTMIGWKRIVVTIGEKIGKRHMTYAEGATAELIAATTIGLASQFGLPVSTTHVLSSGVAGSMVASKGVKNLQRGTVSNIALAWVLTLPVTILLSGSLFLFFRLFA
jgi:PiT family inorganic phosphate transporter